MSTLAVYLPALMCGAMLLLICIPMMRSMHKGDGRSHDPGTGEEIAELREEIARLKAERVSDDPSESVRG